MSDADIEALSTSFKGDIITPTSTGYAQSLSRWAVNTQRSAAMVAQCACEADVQLALAYARKHNLPVAVHGGGHGCSSSVAGGLIISLQRYYGWVQVDAEKKEARRIGGIMSKR